MSEDVDLSPSMKKSWKNFRNNCQKDKIEILDVLLDLETLVREMQYHFSILDKECGASDIAYLLEKCFIQDKIYVSEDNAKILLQSAYTLINYINYKVKNSTHNNKHLNLLLKNSTLLAGFTRIQNQFLFVLTRALYIIVENEDAANPFYYDECEDFFETMPEYSRNSNIKKIEEFIDISADFETLAEFVSEDYFINWTKNFISELCSYIITFPEENFFYQKQNEAMLMMEKSYSLLLENRGEDVLTKFEDMTHFIENIDLEEEPLLKKITASHLAKIKPLLPFFDNKDKLDHTLSYKKQRLQNDAQCSLLSDEDIKKDFARIPYETVKNYRKACAAKNKMAEPSRIVLFLNWIKWLFTPPSKRTIVKMLVADNFKKVGLFKTSPLYKKVKNMKLTQLVRMKSIA